VDSTESAITATDAAALKGVARQSVVAAIKARKIQGVWVDGVWKVDVRSLDAWTPKRVRGNSPAPPRAARAVPVVDVSDGAGVPVEPPSSASSPVEAEMTAAHGQEPSGGHTRRVMETLLAPMSPPVAPDRSMAVAEDGRCRKCQQAQQRELTLQLRLAAVTAERDLLIKRVKESFDASDIW
jgi:hypothetical protein